MIANLNSEQWQTVLYYAAVGCVLTGLFIIFWVALTLRRAGQAGGTGTEHGADAMPTGTVREAERLLRLMGEAEEQATRLTLDYQSRAKRLESLIKDADTRIAGLDFASSNSVSSISDGSSLRTARMDHRTSAADDEPDAAHNSVEHDGPSSPLRVVTRPVPALSPETVGIVSTRTSSTSRDASGAAAMGSQFIDLPDSGSGNTGVSAARGLKTETPVNGSSSSAARQHVAQAPSQTNPDAAAEALAGSIYRLADQGLSAYDIAHRLNQQTGTVELILALRQ